MRRRLAKPEVTVGSWIQLGQAAIAEIMAAAGYDLIVVDLEHSVISLREAEEMTRIIRMSGVDLLVRLSHNDPVQIKRVMDAGADGTFAVLTAFELLEHLHTPETMIRKAFSLLRPGGYFGSSLFPVGRGA